MDQAVETEALAISAEMHGYFGRISADMADFRRSCDACIEHLQAMAADCASMNATMDRMELRFDRIEQHLSISDTD